MYCYLNRLVNTFSRFDIYSVAKLNKILHKNVTIPIKFSHMLHFYLK